MSGYSRALLCALALTIIFASSNAEYWFQSGVRAGNSASQNNGASVSIETIEPQMPTSGSFAFWVGENLQNGAFIQIGYTVENESGNYPTNCTASGCTGRVYLAAGSPTWFYEYFLPGENSTFMGAIGPNDSAGSNGTFNTYSFYSLGDTWYFLFNGKQVGSVNLGTDSSGPNPPVAIAELANSSGITSYMRPVLFENLSAYKYNSFYPVENGYGIISYGSGSKTNVANPYGVEEVDSRVNYFEVGSGLPTSTNGTQLWHLGYWLRISTPFKSLNSSAEYAAYAQVPISVPEKIYIANGERAVFSYWIGRGIGSYTGPLNSTVVNMYSNITESAVYTIQYFVNVTSTPAGFQTYGTGWYSNGSIVKYGILNNAVYSGNSTRFVFEHWTNGNTKPSGIFVATQPLYVSAVYEKEFFVNITSQYGNVTGSGWLAQGSNDTVNVVEPYISVSAGERIAFVAWSNGSTKSSFEMLVEKPISLQAYFAKEYRVSLLAKDASGKNISVENYVVSGKSVNNTPYLQAGSYSVTKAFYKGTQINITYSFAVSGPRLVEISLPVYPLEIYTKDLFGMPVNASISLSFANGTRANFFSGPSGVLYLADVPYGYASGSAFSLFSEAFVAKNGVPVHLVFLSPQSLLVIIVIPLALILFAFWLFKERRMNFNAENKQ
ncbi:MAG: hypothetical protein ACP5TJ_00400 [Candidatus Micrarchaeia archaeon]